MFNLIYYKHMGRCLARSSESHIVFLSIFFIDFNWLSYTIYKIFLVHILSIYIMYQVLQVYTSFSFFANFLSRCIKVGQSSSRRRRLRVAETSRRRRRNFFSIIWSRAGLGDVAETSRRRRGDVAETSSSSKTYLVAATSPRRLRDQMET